MKSIKVTDVGHIKNELNKYKQGKKLEIRQFNQAARLAWLGKVTMQPLDPEDPETRSFLIHIDYPDNFAAHFLNVDEDLAGRVFILDAEQGEYLAQIVEQGVRDRAALLEDLDKRDFYFAKFFKSDEGGDEGGAAG